MKQEQANRNVFFIHVADLTQEGMLVKCTTGCLKMEEGEEKEIIQVFE